MPSSQSPSNTTNPNGQEEETNNSSNLGIFGDSFQEDHSGNLDNDELDIDDDEVDMDMRNHRYANMPTSLLAGLNGIGKGTEILGNTYY